MNNSKTNTTSILGLLVRFLGAMLMVAFMLPGTAFSQQTSVLNSPANLATNQPTTIELKWFASAGESIYNLQIDTSIAVETMTYNDSTLIGVSQIITGLKNSTKYYWRVSVKDSAKNGGEMSAFSTIRSFTTWNTTPVTPLLPVTLGLTGGFAKIGRASCRERV